MPNPGRRGLLPFRSLDTSIFVNVVADSRQYLSITVLEDDVLLSSLRKSMGHFLSLRKKHLLFVKVRGMMQVRYRWRLTVMNVIFNAAQFCYYYYYFFTHKK